MEIITENMNTPNDLNINNKYKVLFVCLGNICRSPAAQGIFEHIVRENGMQDRIEADSAGTYGGHRGELPDRRMRNAYYEWFSNMEQTSSRLFMKYNVDKVSIAVGDDYVKGLMTLFKNR